VLLNAPPIAHNTDIHKQKQLLNPCIPYKYVFIKEAPMAKHGHNIQNIIVTGSCYACKLYTNTTPKFNKFAPIVHPK
jgi:hypothetical protein